MADLLYSQIHEGMTVSASFKGEPRKAFKVIKVENWKTADGRTLYKLTLEDDFIDYGFADRTIKTTYTNP